MVALALSLGERLYLLVTRQNAPVLSQFTYSEVRDMQGLIGPVCYEELYQAVTHLRKQIDSKWDRLLNGALKPNELNLLSTQIRRGFYVLEAAAFMLGTKYPDQQRKPVQPEESGTSAST